MNIWEQSNYRPVPHCGPTVDARSTLGDPSPQILSAFGVRRSAAGVSVNERTSLGLSAVFACVRNLSEDVAKLPLKVYRKLEVGGRQEAVSHPAYRLLGSSPNPEMTSIVARSAITASAVLYGRGFAEIEWRNNGKPAAIWPIAPWRCHLVRDAAKRLYVDVDGGTALKLEDVLYLPGFTLDGLVGEMIAALGTDSLGLAMAAQRFAGSFFGNGASPGMVLSHPGTLSQQARTNIAESWNAAHGGPGKAYKTAVLEEGVKIEKTSWNPQESQAIESRQFAVEDVARWFRMPPHKIGHLLRATGWSTLEATNTDYVVDTLLPWLTKWEQECDSKLLAGGGLYTRHVLQMMLRGDHVSRAQFYRTMREIGVMDANDIAELEDLNPVGEGGDLHYIAANLVPLGTLPRQTVPKE